MSGTTARRLLRALGIAVLTAGALEAALAAAIHGSPVIRRFLSMRIVRPGEDYRDLTTARELVMASPWSLGPGADCFGYRLNSNGLRTPEYAVARTPGRRRVVLLGDSFLVEGNRQPGDAHFVSFLEAGLGRADRTEVINLAVTGVGIRFYRRMLEVEGRRLHPDVVLVALYAGNDLTDEPVTGAALPWTTRLALASRTCRLIRNLWRLASFSPTGHDLWRPRDPAAPAFSPEGFLAMELERSALFEDPWPPAIAQQWEGARDDLRAMAAWASADHFRLIVMVIPAEVQVNRALRERIVAATGGRALDFDLPQRAMAEAARTDRMTLLDLLPHFRAAAVGTSLYTPLDTHWNAAGERLAARLAAGAIRAALGR